ncbi:hypothetical protein GCM10027047_20000 [Rhodococcus aerolatus]
MSPGPRVLGGRYALRGALGSGGMGVVHDGWDTRLDRAVAVKELRAELAGQPDVRRRFEAEARAAATLTHPHVVSVHDTGEDDGVPWIVMERLPGPSLAELLADGPLPAARLRATLTGALAALAAAHDRGILHRDVKPGNVLLGADGAVKVTDFGIAKSAATTDHTATGMVLGTVAYLSPSRLRGAPATVSDDLWAAGVLGWEAAVGHRPFAGDNLLALARAISDHPAPPVGSARPDLDPDLAAVVDRLLEREPARRYPEARAALAVLAGGTGAAAGAATRPVTRVLPAGPATAVAPAARSAGGPGGARLAGGLGRGWLWGLAALAALVLGAVVLLAGAGSGADPAVPAPTTGPVPATTGPVAPATTPVTTPADPTTTDPTTTVAPVPAPGGGGNGGGGNGNGGGGPGGGKPTKEPKPGKDDG